MNKDFKELYQADLSRYVQPSDGKLGGVKQLWNTAYERKLLYYFRKCQATKNRRKIQNIYYKLRLSMLRNKHHIEISPETNIGKGLYIGHSYGITINHRAVIGEYCAIHKGVTIGQENRGIRRGAPQIGNCVWIGINATIVGNIKIGSDVLIAPNSYVNQDIPDHSIVFGNPCVIKHREWATEAYIQELP